MSTPASVCEAAGGVAVRAATVLGVVGEPVDWVGYLRFVQPFERLRSAGLELRTLGHSLVLRDGPRGPLPSAELIDGVEAVVFPQMVASPRLPDGRRVELVAWLCEIARQRGLPVVYSADDHVEAVAGHNPGHDRIAPSLHNLRHIRDHATAVVATTAILAETLSRWRRPVHVVPNAVDPSRFAHRPQGSRELRVGWAGSASHLEDVLLVLPALDRLRRRVAFRLVVSGLTDLPLDEQVRRIERDRAELDPVRRDRAERFLELARRLIELGCDHRPWVPAAEWFATLPAMDLDVGLCPLADTPFNRHKSAIKFYEYAAAGTLTVASRVPPYQDEVSLCAWNDPRHWCELLEEVLRDAALRERELARQRDFVLSERTVEAVAPLWRAAFEEILHDRTD